MKRSKNKKKIAQTEKPVHIERRIRVIFFLPAGTRKDIDTVAEVISFLDSQFLFPPTEFTITGFTHSGIPSEEKKANKSLLEDEIFVGHWWSDVKVRKGGRTFNKLMIESAVFFLIDYLALAQEWEFDQELLRLKENIFSIYKKYKSPQEEIWIVKQDIYRYA